MTEITETLTHRGQKYGPYSAMAAMTQAIKSNLRMSHHWRELPPYMQESLDMVALKMARIVCGDPTLVDSWHDIQGYAKLVEERLRDATIDEPKAPVVQSAPVPPR